MRRIGGEWQLESAETMAWTAGDREAGAGEANGGTGEADGARLVAAGLGIRGTRWESPPGPLDDLLEREGQCRRCRRCDTQRDQYLVLLQLPGGT